MSHLQIQLSQLLNKLRFDRLCEVKMVSATFCYHFQDVLWKEFYTYLDMCLWVVIVLKCVFAWEHIIIFPFLVALNQNINWAPGDFLSTKRLMNRTALAVHTTNETTVNLNNLNEHLLLDTSYRRKVATSHL